VPHVGFDAQAIEGWNGPGPYLIDNNHLEGSGENIMFGGADPGIVDLRPCDITISAELRDEAARVEGQVVGQESLRAEERPPHPLIEEQRLPPDWPASQEGMAIVIKSSVGGGTVLNEGTTDVLFRYNIVDSAAVGFNLQAVDCSGRRARPSTWRACASSTTSSPTSARRSTATAGALMLLTHDYANVAFVHNTMLHAPARAG
jgi:hypothetical protein